MEFYYTILPFAKVILTFIIILLCIRFKTGLAPAIFLGAASLALFFGLGPASWAKVSGLALTKEKFLLLAAIVGNILILSDGLERSGQSKRLMGALSGYLVSPRLRLVFFPALIGLLPMPGGAVFSAPMVKAISEGMQLKNEQKAVINYWFRHVWEMAWPLYPGIILTVSLADIPISALISKTWPGVVAMFGIGWFFFLRPGVLNIEKGVVASEPSKKNIFLVLQEGLPLLVAIVGAIGLETLLEKYFSTIPFELGVIAALVAAVCCIMVQNRLGLDFLKQVLCKKSLWTMLAVIAAIFIFKDTMGAAGVVDAMAEAAGGRAALFAAAVFLPFLVGMVSGINVAFVGATFPLLIGLLHTLGMQEQVIPYIILASFSGFTGVMISPIHICFVLTCDYFGAEIMTSWKKLVMPSVMFGLVGSGLFFYFL